jgi:NitT/TauT family transport system substrate-binding protein
MKKGNWFIILLVFPALVFSLSCVSLPSSNSTAITSSTASLSPEISSRIAPLESIRLVGTIGPLSLPLAYMLENNSLRSIASRTTLSLWSNPEQLHAIVSSLQADFVALPTNSAALYYNKGIPLKLMDCSIWNILYLVTSDSGIHSITDLKGKRLVIPYQGSVPDAMFRFIWQQYGLDPDRDIDIYYAPDPVQASQLLLLGKEEYVLLSEPSATSVILKGQNNGNIFLRALNMEAEWKKANRNDSSTPVAGSIVLGALKDRPEIVDTFTAEYQKAVKWMMSNPQEAGVLGAKVLSETGFTSRVLTDSMVNISWRWTAAQDARSDLESFFLALSRVSPDYIGQALPDNGFYYYGK